MTTLQKTLGKLLTKLNLKLRIIFPCLLLIALLIIILVHISTTGNNISAGLLLMTIITFLAVVGLGLLLAQDLDRRINQIIEAVEKAAGGDLSARIEDNYGDEIGHLSKAFNQMIANIDHLYHSRDLLSRTMSPAVRRSLIETGLDFRGLTQQVSILFVDIRDFTAIMERHNTEQLVFFLNDYYTSIANQVHSGGGIIGKYGGDSILAYFGAPNPEPVAKSSTAALLAALALQETITELSQRWEFLGLPPIRIGIGMSIGEVVAGPIGSEEQFEYTIIGDAVNLASRLQGLTRNVPGIDIILSKDVYDALEQKIQEQVQVISLQHHQSMDKRERARSLFVFVDFGEVLVKGKKGPVHVYGIPE